MKQIMSRRASAGRRLSKLLIYYSTAVMNVQRQIKKSIKHIGVLCVIRKTSNKYDRNEFMLYV